MPFLAQITESWRRPRVAMRRQLAGPVREDRALAMLMGACGLMFLARWPASFAAAARDPAIPAEAHLAGALMAIVFLAPLLFYALAALSHLALRPFGGQGSHYAARLALFRALLAVAPAMLLQALAQAGLAGLLMPEAGRMVAAGLGCFVMAAFLAIWGAGLRVAEFERDG